MASGCGNQSDADKWEFFQTELSACVNMCDVCAEWSVMCKHQQFDLFSCVNSHWITFKGVSNRTYTSNNFCNAGRHLIETLTLTGNCSENNYGWLCNQ